MSHKITVPNDALIVLVGPAGSGKSTFAAKHFSPTEIVSSDEFRGRVCDDITNQAASGAAFDLFHRLIGHRLKFGRLTVADATNVREGSRSSLRHVAGEHERPVVVFRFNTPVERCLELNAARVRNVPEHVVKTHAEQAEETRQVLDQEGYHAVHSINIDRQYEIVRYDGTADEVAPGYDVVGDIHGCFSEFTTLLQTLGYRSMRVGGQNKLRWAHPDGRKLVLVGDLTDRGPNSLHVLRLVMALREDGHLMVLGNHDSKLLRALKGNPVKRGHGLQQTLEELALKTSDDEQIAIRDMLAKVPYQLRLTVPGHPDLVVCHAGIPRQMVGRTDKAANAHCLYGEVLGFAEDGLSIRGTSWEASWAASADAPVLVHGHTVTEDPWPADMVNVVNVDQGCVFGGKLTAFRYPEGDVTQVDAEWEYARKDP